MEKIIVHDGISNEVFDFKTFEEAKEMILEEYVQEGSIHPDIECVKIFKQMFETKVTETKPNFYKVEFEELEAQTIGQAEVRVSQPSELTCESCGHWNTKNLECKHDIIYFNRYKEGFYSITDSKTGSEKFYCSRHTQLEQP